MAPALFRKRKPPAAAPDSQGAPAPPSAPTTPALAAPPDARTSFTVTAPPPDPPRSYAQLADLADEIVATSWDAALPVQLWLSGIAQLATEGNTFRAQGDYDMTFVRAATALKLLSDVLPHHHPEWQSLTPAQANSALQLIQAASTAYATLKSHLIARTTSFYASRSPLSASTAQQRHSPALTLRNTVTTAATVYHDGPGPSRDAPPREGTHPRRSGTGPLAPPLGTRTAPPRANRLRAAFSRAQPAPLLGGPARGALPEPGAGHAAPDGAEQDVHALSPSAVGVTGTDELLPRGEGRRIPKLGEAVLRPVAPAYGTAALRSRDFQAGTWHAGGAAEPSAPMPLPGEEDEEEEEEEEEETGACRVAHVAPAHAQGFDARAAAWPHGGSPAAAWTASSQVGAFASAPLAPTQARLEQAHAHAVAQGLSGSVTLPATAPTWTHPHLPQHHYSAAPPHNPSSHPPHPAAHAPFPPPLPVPPVPPLPSAPPHPPAPLPTTQLPPAPSAPPAATPSPAPFALPTRDSLACAPAPSAPSPAPSSPSPGPSAAGLGRGVVQSFAALGVDGRGGSVSGEAGLGTATQLGGGDAKAVAHNEGSAPLRRVVLPSRLISHFMHVVASQNTARNVETCGLLLGTETGGEFGVSTLLVPKQEGTADTCVATNEEETVAFQEARGLLTLGWIHTHPTQSIFLSSLDLHTHHGFQSLLREAIAVVCAPSAGPDEPQCGVFRMTDPPGMGAVGACREGGAFHPHPPLPLYTDVDEEGGHCQVDDDAPFECVDMR